ncbi:Protein of unknown function [Pyronema omphalodes CBS 100304]|uniref:Uncharacterized protein n=1 Tax=Pyronema omphalodes (strain CBS 100304) TaxID=1076935 RepID=U4KY80_PYROM|nr:Protein of unknown function [Pyronema omphalodes CBS 100304]
MVKRNRQSSPAVDQVSKKTRRGVSGSPPPEIPSSSTQPSAAYTTAERFYQESTKNLVSGARARATNLWTQVQTKRGQKLNIMADEVEPKQPFAFVAIWRVKWVTLASPNQWKEFDLTVELEVADALVGAAVQNILERSPALIAKGPASLALLGWNDVFSKEEQSRLKETTLSFSNVLDGRNPLPEGGSL